MPHREFIGMYCTICTCRMPNNGRQIIQCAAYKEWYCYTRSMDLRDCAAPSMDPLIAHLSVDRAFIDRSCNNRNCAIDQLRTDVAQSIDRAAIESAQSVDCLRSISSHLGTCLLLVSKYYGFPLHMFYLELPSPSL